MEKIKHMSRRELIQTAGAAAAAAAMTNLTETVEASPRPKVILGSGSHRYECIHDWLTPPEGLLWGDTHGIAEDSHGRIYISHTVHPTSKSGNAIVVYDKNGKFLKSWGEQFRGGGHGLDLRREGEHEYLYHCNVAHNKVVKTTLDGDVVWEKQRPAESDVYGEKDPFVPTNVAFSPNGDFYVADGYGSSWIHQYDLKGNYIRTFGGKGKDPGKVDCPHGLWVDTRKSEPVLVVADRGNNRLQYFSLDGKHIGFVQEGMRQPCHFSLRGDEMLIPDLKSVVTIVDKENKVITMLGDGDPSGLRDHPRADFIPGKFIHPHSAKFLHNGDILVVEWVPIGRVTRLKHLRA